VEDIHELGRSKGYCIGSERKRASCARDTSRDTSTPLGADTVSLKLITETHYRSTLQPSITVNRYPGVGVKKTSAIYRLFALTEFPLVLFPHVLSLIHTS
jgi:hypothetical protein